MDVLEGQCGGGESDADADDGCADIEPHGALPCEDAQAGESHADAHDSPEHRDEEGGSDEGHEDRSGQPSFEGVEEGACVSRDFECGVEFELVDAHVSCADGLVFTECDCEQYECSCEVEHKSAEDLDFGVDSAYPPEQCEPGECVECEDIAVPEEVCVDEAEEEEPCASDVPERGAGAEFGVVVAFFVGGVELPGVHDDA